MRSLIVVFVDGLGIGEKNPLQNPLACFEPRILRLFRNQLGPFPDAGLCRETDVQMGVSGLPQSATNQTTLWTGVNAAEALGGHRSGFPNAFLRSLIQRDSLFKRLRSAGCRIAFANGYSPGFFQKRPRWVSVSTVLCESSGVRLRTLDDVREGRSLYMDLSQQLLRDQGHDVPVYSPAQAAAVLVDLADDYHLCVYEFFLTDIAGHRGSLKEAIALLWNLDCFLLEILRRLHPSSALLVTSDHGNIEEMGHRQHTRNRVGTLLWGDIQEAAKPFQNPLLLSEVASLIETYLIESEP